MRSFVNNPPFADRARRARQEHRGVANRPLQDQDRLRPPRRRARAARHPGTASSSSGPSPTKGGPGKDPERRDRGHAARDVRHDRLRVEPGCRARTRSGLPAPVRNASRFVAQLGAMNVIAILFGITGGFAYLIAVAGFGTVSNVEPHLAVHRVRLGPRDRRAARMAVPLRAAAPGVEARADARRHFADRPGAAASASRSTRSHRRSSSRTNGPRHASTSTTTSTVRSKRVCPRDDDVPAPVPAVPRERRDREHGRLRGLHGLPAHEEPAVELRRHEGPARGRLAAEPLDLRPGRRRSRRSHPSASKASSSTAPVSPTTRRASFPRRVPVVGEPKVRSRDGRLLYFDLTGLRARLDREVGPAGVDLVEADRARRAGRLDGLLVPRTGVRRPDALGRASRPRRSTSTTPPAHRSRPPCRRPSSRTRWRRPSRCAGPTAPRCAPRRAATAAWERPDHAPARQVEAAVRPSSGPRVVAKGDRRTLQFALEHYSFGPQFDSPGRGLGPTSSTTVPRRIVPG